MKRNHIFKLTAVLMIAGSLLQGCTKKLDLVPENTTTSEVVFSTANGYRQALAKAYVAMAVTGNIPAEIVKDDGSTGFLRQFFNLQCLSTDEGAWNFSGDTDPVGIHQMTWTANTQAVAGSYYRSFYVITLCNNIIKEASEANVGKRGFSGIDATSIKTYKAEARFLRAFNYWVLMDLFGNVPFADENLVVGSGVIPQQIRRADLFTYLETELKSMEADLPTPKTNEYGRVDKAAAWSLLARMYLNAQTYTGTGRFTDAITYANKVITAGYTLHNNYKELMLADNHLNTDEFIWTIQYDGTYTQTYSGTTFLAHAPAGVTGDSSGTSGNWDCLRMTQQFVDKFTAQDIRGQFWVATQTKNLDTLLNAARNGYSSTKFRNKTRTGLLAPHIDPGKTFTDIDMPIFRLAEMYLIYAESVVRGGTGGDNATALTYLQRLAVRARPSDASASSYPQLTLQYILDERGRELFWEGFRRTDLIRYNQFTTNTYLWAWKGNVRSGTAVDSKYNLYPIPSSDISSNPNLVQNPGY
jgi:hypothetical protein